MWSRIEPLMPADPVRGRRWVDHRRTLEAIAWKYRTGSPWRDLPDELGLEVARIGALGTPATERAQVPVIMELRHSVITGETCARPTVMAHRTALGPIRSPAAWAGGVPPGPSTRLPPSAHQRPYRLRQDAAAAALRLFLRGDRRHDLLGHHDPQPPRQVDTAGGFARLKQIALDSYDRIVGLVLDQIAGDGSITKAPGGGEVAGRSPVDRCKQGLKRSGITDGYGIPLGRVPAGANRHDSPLLAPTLDRLDDWTTWGRCPSTSPCTWTPATTRTRPAPC